MRKYQAHRLVVAGCIAGGVAASARAQPCTGCYSSNATYGADAAGTYWAVPNNTARVPALLADPSVVKIGSWYYVTGTSDGYWTANFVIYKSQNLINWTYHGTAFKESGRVNGLLSINAYDGSTQPGELCRQFSNMWAPQLYVDGSNVWLSFTATEDRGLGYATMADAMRYQSVYAATCTTTAFTTGLDTAGQPFSFANETDGRGYEPLWYYYQVNNNVASPGKLDGGYAQSQAQGWTHTIPVTGSPQLYLAGQPCGTNYPVYENGYRYGHRCMGTNTYMCLDSFVYVDPADSNKRWMLYTWVVDEFGSGSWDGNHVAGHPMVSNDRMDASASASLLQFAFRENANFPLCPSGCINNGRSGADGLAMGGNYSVAEAPAAFRWNGYTYLLFSRNGWNSPAYGMFYRKSTGALGSMGLTWGDPNINNVTEQSLLVSANRTLAYGPSFGHGEVFIGPGNKPYLVFHAKGQGSAGSPYPPRYVYFKELTIDGTTGNISTLSNPGGSASATNVSHFLVPK